MHSFHGLRSYLTMWFEKLVGLMMLAIPRSVHGCFLDKTELNLDAVSLLARAACQVGLLACCLVFISSTLASSDESFRSLIETNIGAPKSNFDCTKCIVSKF